MATTDPVTVATVGAGAFEEEALVEALKRRGFVPGTVLAFARERGRVELALDDAGARVYLPLEREHLSRADAVFLFSCSASARQELEAWAPEDNYWLVDLEAGAPGPWARPGVTGQALRAMGPRFAVCDPDAWCTAALWESVAHLGPGPAACVAFRPASTRGEEGVRELFRQSAAALNFKEGPVEVFGQKVAFNLCPEVDPPAEEAAFQGCLRALAGPDARASRAIFRVPVFHAAGLSVLIPLADPAAAARAASSGLRRAGFSVLRGESWPSALEGQDKNVPRVRVAPLAGGHLQAWFFYDELKAGRAELGAAALTALSAGD